jgi:hypothetical protein
MFFILLLVGLFVFFFELLSLFNVSCLYRYKILLKRDREKVLPPYVSSGAQVFLRPNAQYFLFVWSIFHCVSPLLFCLLGY